MSHAHRATEKCNDEDVGPGGWSSVADTEPGGAETILLVEDEAFVRNVIREILRGAGYAVLTYCSAADVLGAWDEHHGEFKLLLTDVVLPGETGRALAQRLRSQIPGLPVLFITGYAEQMDVRETESAECLPKPFSTDVLLRRVRELLDRRQGSLLVTNGASIRQDRPAGANFGAASYLEGQEF